MFLLALLRYALLLLTPIALLSTTYLYLYPVFHLCAFPSPTRDAPASFLKTLPPLSSIPTKQAPFRLLALGDPQLEGESSIRDLRAPLFPNFHRLLSDVSPFSSTHNPLQRLRHSLHDLIDFYLDDIPSFLEVLRKRVDFIGNDYYLGLIYRTLSWWTDPTHVTVLGDLVGSQWVDDEEFERRGWRYWNRVFKGGRRVEDEVARDPSEDFRGVEELGADPTWKHRIINVAGNHDIGYAGDLTEERMTRFIRVFGKANYEVRFQLPVNTTKTQDTDRPPPLETPELRIILLNSMNLDTPALSTPLQTQTYDFLNEIITTSHAVTRQAHFTLLLTHIPLYKPAGICVDGPFFDFYSDEFVDFHGVREQNHLSAPASKGVLEGIFGMSGDPSAPGGGWGRHGIVLNGHDHEGCDVYHYINQSEPAEREWRSSRYVDAVKDGVRDKSSVPGLREVTVRSMMGGFGGNAGLLSLWFDEEEWDWRFEFANCALGTQHRWWAVHVLDLIVIGGGLLYGLLIGLERAGVLSRGSAEPDVRKKKVEEVKVVMMGNGVATEPAKANGHLDTPALKEKNGSESLANKTRNGKAT